MGSQGRHNILYVCMYVCIYVCPLLAVPRLCLHAVQIQWHFSVMLKNN